MAPDQRLYVLVGGPPANGKSTLAGPLAEVLGLPLVAEDVIKEAMAGELGVPDVEASRRLGLASVAVMFVVAAAAPDGAVLDGFTGVAVGGAP